VLVKEPISVVVNRLRDTRGCCTDPFERFSAERVERVTGVPAEQVHLIAQGLVEPDHRNDERLRLLDELMDRVSPPQGTTFERWLLTRQKDAAAAPALLIRELRRSELAG
jgi:hypothetical protein